MAAPQYAYSGTIVMSRAEFDAWVVRQLPQGPFYAFGIPEWIDLQTFKVPYNASSSSQPEPPVGPAVQPA